MGSRSRKEKSLAVLHQQLFLSETTHRFFLRLAHYHPVKQAAPIFKYIYGLFPKPPWSKVHPHPVAVIVYAPPVPSLRARARALRGQINFPRDRKQNLRLVNANILYISKLIVDPRYHNLGLATWLLKETIALQHVPYIESLTPIDYTNKIFAHCGFTTLYNPAPPYYARLVTALTAAGVGAALYDHPHQVNLRIERMPAEQKAIVLYEMQRFANHFKSHGSGPHSLERTAYILGKLSYPQAYHLYTTNNPVTSG